MWQSGDKGIAVIGFASAACFPSRLSGGLVLRDAEKDHR